MTRECPLDTKGDNGKCPLEVQLGSPDVGRVARQMDSNATDIDIAAEPDHSNINQHRIARGAPTGTWLYPRRTREVRLDGQRTRRRTDADLADGHHVNNNYAMGGARRHGPQGDRHATSGIVRAIMVNRDTT